MPEVSRILKARVALTERITKQVKTEMDGTFDDERLKDLISAPIIMMCVGAAGDGFDAGIEAMENENTGSD